ncbi:sensor histidine kinase [Variovorax sp. J22R115]|uniref:sensor histidine kinase n=1 Tax=Variovorax sp. J22R115 TaxID=3053509 RepID=UPI002575DD81|nr:sensor histidine kinase [Variovorax sp. J22R115]MDM0050586.1 sensor histidine kinase [Variovorax sp. J22R115]
MGLSEFISANSAAIVAEAVVYARSLAPLAQQTEETLRDHIPKILDAIVLDMNQEQSQAESRAKSLGGGKDGTLGTPATAAETHGRLRAKGGLHVAQLVAEYRALRASVLRLWADSHPHTSSIAEVIRFNEAIDQAIAESVEYFSEEMDQLRNIFLGVLGHDLRGPLNAILLTSELITQLANDPKISAPLGVLIRSGRRMASLLDTLLEYNRSVLGSGIPIHRKEADLAVECAAELELLKAALPRAVVTLSCSGDVNGEFDASRIREALGNLVANATAYGAKDEAIAVALSESQGCVLLSVSNAGPEIPAAEIARLFQPLQRGSHAGSASSRTNLGLGLFIVDQIARAHGGEIRCESQGGLTVFELRLPKGSQPILG